jgi:hypothetical protein
VLRERDGGTALVIAFFLQLNRFVCLTHPSLDEPWNFLKSLEPVPKTCPQIGRGVQPSSALEIEARFYSTG